MKQVDSFRVHESKEREAIAAREKESRKGSAFSKAIMQAVSVLGIEAKANGGALSGAITSVDDERQEGDQGTGDGGGDGVGGGDGLTKSLPADEEHKANRKGGDVKARMLKAVGSSLGRSGDGEQVARNASVNLDEQDNGRVFRLHSHKGWKSGLEIVVEHEMHVLKDIPIFEQLITAKWNTFGRSHHFKYAVFPYLVFFVCYNVGMAMR